MQTKKSFIEIFERSVFTFKNSFWGIFITYCFAAPFLAIAYYVANYVQANKSNPSPVMIAIAFVLLISYFFGFVLLQTWQLLVIKNNIFTGTNNLFEAFKKALFKSLQVCLVSIILLPIFIFLSFLAVEFFPSCLDFYPLLCIPFLPLAMLFPTGIILQDGKFINVLISSIGVCLSHYFKILGYIILMMILPILAMILIAMLMIFPLFWFIAIILMGFLQLTIVPFYSCFLAELYFDLAIIDDEKTIEDLTELSKSYPDVIDINQIQEPSSKDGASQPGETSHKDEVPEGLRELGGNYEDKK